MSGTIASGSAPLEGRVLGRYVLVRLLGEGGMGMVYEAVHQDLGKRVAVKTLHQRHAAVPDTRLRFLREGRNASRIRHPNVADVYDVGVEEGQPYLVMEFLEGEELARRIAREAPLSVETTADLLVPVVAAVAAAHDLGVVHRDLKPANIFLSAERGTVKPKVLDFGISKVVDREDPYTLTESGAILGTPFYLSPEQAQGTRHADARSDQYAVGVILYECVTGRRPIDETSLYPLLQRIVHGDFPPPRQVHPKLSRAFEELILQAMARDPAQRFPTTQALGSALLGFASERVRANFADELARDHRASAPPVVAGRASNPLEAATTVGDDEPPRPRKTPGETLESARPLTRQRRTLSRAVLPAVAIALAAILALSLRKRATPAPAPVAASDETPAAAAAVPAAAQPLRTRMLTSLPSANPVWRSEISADGKRYSYQDSTGVWLGSMEGGAPRRLKQIGIPQQNAATLMPDGSTVAVLRKAASGSPSDAYEIALFSIDVETPRVVPLNGPGTMQIGTGAALLQPRSDGHEIAVGATGSLLAIDVDSGRTRTVTALGPQSFVAGAAWSPDGSRLAFVASSTAAPAPTTELVVVQSDGLGSRRLLADRRLRADRGRGSALVWLDERRIAFSQLNDIVEPPGCALWVLDVGDRTATSSPGSPRLLHRWEHQFGLDLSVSRDSRRLLAVLTRTQGDVFVGDLGKGGSKLSNVVRLTLDEGDDRPSAWLGDGRVLFMSDRFGTWDVLAQAPGSADAEVIAGTSSWETWPGTIGPSIAFWRIDPGPVPTSGVRMAELVSLNGPGKGKELLRRPVEGLRRESAPPPHTLHFHCAGAETPACVLGDDHDGAYTVRRFDPVTGRLEEPLYERTGSTAGEVDLAPDGHTIALVAQDISGLVLIRTATGEAREIKLEPGLWQSVHWTPDGSALLLTGMMFRGHAYVIARTDLHGKIDLLYTSETAWLTQALPSPDASRLAFGSLAYEGNVQLLEGW